MNVAKFLIGSLAFCASATVRVEGQVVQLPVVRQFSVGTTVSVPDRGAATLGGVSQAGGSGVVGGVPVLSRVPGLAPFFRHRALGYQRGHGHTTIRATIIDFEEHEAALFDRHTSAIVTPQRRPDPVREKALFLSQHVGRSAANRQLQASVKHASADGRAVARRQASPEPALRLAPPRR